MGWDTTGKGPGAATRGTVPNMEVLKGYVSCFLITKVSSGLAHLFLLTSMAMFTDYFGQQAVKV
jgi:hypothetical protein